MCDLRDVLACAGHYDYLVPVTSLGGDAAAE